MRRSDFLLGVTDWVMALLAWFSFFVYRKKVETGIFDVDIVLSDTKLYYGLVIIPTIWLVFWSILGLYEDVRRKSRIRTLYTTSIGALIGCLGLLFSVMRDDLTLQFTSYLTSFLAVFLIHWTLFVFGRILYLSLIKVLIANKVIRFKRGFITDHSITIDDRFKNGHIVVDSKDFQKVLDDDETDNLYVMISQKEQINRLLPEIIGRSKKKALYIHEQSYALLDLNIHGTPSLRDAFITISTSPISSWERNIKRIMDVTVSIVAMMLLAPLYTWLRYQVKSGSEGPSIYRQKRVGLYGEEFEILKIRSMVENAEEKGPQLAQASDDRCTPIGRWMRRWRLDEIPQFRNVLKGEMSLVGPRPERPHYTHQLLEQNPRYSLLWQVRPGITSWGQIKFGYASNIEEMLKRFRYDLLYMENMSLPLDLRILYYTLIVLIQGKGR